jgi:hypothetical protein
MKILVAKMALAASVAFATLIAAEAASAQPQRQQAASEAYDDQANPNYGFDPSATIDERTGGQPGCRYLYSGGPKMPATC